MENKKTVTKSIATIFEELKRIQKELKAPKSQFNAFGKYKYRNLEDIMEAYKKVAGDTILVISDEIKNIGDRYYVEATVTLRGDREEISVKAYARESEIKKGMDEAQITGATSSYARKYAVNGLFAIDDTKDADSKDNSQAQIESLIGKVNILKTVEELKDFYVKHKGVGKEFDKAVMDRKKELTKVEPAKNNGEDDEGYEEYLKNNKL